MFSEKEKKELMDDARSEQRRKDFEIVDNLPMRQLTLDEYIDFLMQLQTIFGPFPISREITIMKINKIL